MAAVSVFESHQASTPTMLVDDLDEVELIQLFRPLNTAQKQAIIVLVTGMAGPRLAPWQRHKPGSV